MFQLINPPPNFTSIPAGSRVEGDGVRRSPPKGPWPGLPADEAVHGTFLVRNFFYLLSSSRPDQLILRSEPQDLRYLAWNSVRRSLGPRRLERASGQLGLPPPLTRYLTLAQARRPTFK